MNDKAQILVNLFDGARQPLVAPGEWRVRCTDGRPVGERQTLEFSGNSSSALMSVPFFDNLFDNYAVTITQDGRQDGGWFPVHVHNSAPVTVNLMSLPTGGEPHFTDATWTRLNASRRGFAQIIRRGCADDSDAADKYGVVLEKSGKALACFLNIATAMSDIVFPSGKGPLDYYWNIAWPVGSSGNSDWLTRLDGVFRQDRFFCYVDADMLPDLRKAAKLGSFAPELNPGFFHPDATESYKQTQFDVGNVQLTIHGHDRFTLTRDDGTQVNCVKIEPDIDYDKDLISHGLTEVLPNLLGHGKTDPVMAMALRWMAGRNAGLASFNPLFTVEGPAGA